MKKKTTKLFSFQKLVIILLLSSILPISGCYLDLNGRGNSGTDPEEITPVSAETHFSLNLPTSLNEGERIILEILDEVTGLPYNGRFYDMTMVSAQEYILDLSFQSGSVVKYRYHRMGAALSHEAAADGTDVCYRLLSINGETTVSDVLQSWQGDSSPAPDAGSLTGTVIDQATQQPLADILVSVGGNLSFTDANGHFTIQRLAPGVQNVVFYAPDGQYRTYQQGAVIVSGLTTTADVMLTEQPLVQVTFHVTTPNDALGIPVYLAGNLLQLGNTFTDLNGGMSGKPKQMPMLIPQEDGTFQLTLDLHAGTDLRYKFTLGDGYWNAERTGEGGINVRQLIVPDHSVSLDLSIASWRSPGVERLLSTSPFRWITIPVMKNISSWGPRPGLNPYPCGRLGMGTTFSLYFHLWMFLPRFHIVSVAMKIVNKPWTRKV